MLEKMEEFSQDKVIEKFEAMTKNADIVQRETLQKILEENGGAEYLQKLGLNGRTDPESFKSCVPLVTHKDLEPYIKRIMDGDASPILTGKPITTISLSSGTTQGKSKYIPCTDELLANTMEIFSTSFAFRNREFPIRNGKALQFIYGSKKFKTTGGVTAGTATSHLFSSSQYKTLMKSMNSYCSSPEEVIYGPDFHQSLYCHLLCALIFQDEIQFVFASFAYSIVHAFRTFEHIWEELCSDIRDGVLTSRVTVPSIRTALTKLLKPNPELADLIHTKCSGLSNWYGLIPALFPNARYVFGIMTGSMELYVKKLRHYAGDLPLLSADYGASEGWVGVNIHPKLPPELVTFAVLPDIGYFEFKPIRGNIEDRDPVGLTEVKEGEEYEILVTNFTGMYRYSLGDIVKVVGFYNKTPELQFVCRSNLVLNINIDKTTEKDLQLAVEAAGKLLANEKLELVDFTSHADVSTDPGHYIIFWEVNGEASEDVLNECCKCMDLSFVDAGYASSRKVGTIGPLELRIVGRGTFQKIVNHFVGLGGAVNQFKTPRCVGPAHKMVLQILNENVVNSYFSTSI